MPENKKHHYVPQFYFRNFSPDAGIAPEGSESIFLYNLKRRVHIPSVQIKNQCQEDYLYSRDPAVEKELSKLEGFWAPVVAEIIATNSRPVIGSEKHTHLLTFLACQDSRTVAAGKATKEIAVRSVNAFKKEFVYSLGNQVMNENSFKLANDYPALASLQSFLIMVPSLADLCVKILVNKTDVEFITSDSPVAVFNQWCQDSEKVANLGLASMGIQVFFPISPRHVVVFFDSLIYVMGKGSKAIEVNCASDVKMINSMQLISAEENLYYSGDEKTGKEIELLPFELHKPLEDIYDGVRVVETDEDSEKIHFSLKPSLLKLDLSFMKIQNSKKKTPLIERLKLYRKAAMDASAKVTGVRPENLILGANEVSTFISGEKI